MLTTEAETMRIEEQAYEWLACMNSDQRTEAEFDAFRAWLDENPTHRVIYDEITLVWSDIEAAGALIERDEMLDDFKWSGWQRLAARFEQVVSDRPVQVAMASAAALVLVLGLYLAQPALDSEVHSREVATQTAELKEVRLPDGSTVTLGALSAIEVNYSLDQRRVELVAGEAFFAVEKDPARPFVVVTTDAEVRVLGTKFDVRRASGGVRISVLEGVVEVTQVQQREVDGIATPVKVTQVLTASQKIRTHTKAEMSEPSPVSQDHPGAWREGRLVYERASLADVISDVDRYYTGNIIIDTDDLKELPISATFKTDKIQEMMDILPTVLPVSVKKLSNGDIIVRRKETGQG